MADFNKDIENLQNELDRIEQSIQGIAGTMKTSITLSLKSGLDSARKLTEEFSKGENITKKLKTELDKNKAAIEATFLKQIRLQSLLSTAIRNGNTLREQSLRSSLNDLNIQRQILAQTDTQLRQLERVNEEKRKQNNITDIAKKKLKEFNATYLSTLGILKFIVDAALKADVQTTELAKSLGIGKDQANGIRQEFVRYSQASNDSFVTTTKLLEAQSQLSEQLGVSVKYSGKQAEDFSRLTKLMGLSAEQAGKLARLSIVNGTSIENTAKSIIKGSAASQRANRLSVDQRTILKDVSNLSEGILIKFQGNPEALGAAVVQARKLGLTLSEVDKIGESLLNWESSIENELQAELITGRKLNFERARAAALTGDQAALMQEIGSQVGSLSDFQNMNVIAQKSLAQAFGLSRDEMSKMLLEQEKINKLGDVSQMTLDEQLKALRAQGEPLDSALYKQIQQQSAQEKFNNAVEKLQDLLGNLVAGPLGQLIDGFANLVSHAWAVKAAMIAIGAISFAKTIGSLVTMAATLAASSVAGTTLASALTLGLGAAAIIAGIVAVAGMMSSATEEATSKAQAVKDGVAPAGNGPFTIMDGFGRTAITAAGDGLAVSPNISTGGGNNADIIYALKEVRNAITSKSNDVYLGQEKVGAIMGRTPTTANGLYGNSYQVA